MARIIAWIETVALGIGAPGLFIIAFLDSSFLSFPEVNDLLIVMLVINNPERMVLYATIATLGSVAGCLALYYVGRKGGEALIEKRFKGGMVERAAALMRRYGALALIVPALLPPPAPFKIFVLMGGVANIPRRRYLGHRPGPGRPILWRRDSRRDVRQAGARLHSRERHVPSVALGVPCSRVAPPTSGSIAHSPRPDHLEKPAVVRRSFTRRRKVV